jgi:ectoine hydroxylase-related dioxygenase (phytanoyl-CoA dioxygenase family)
MSLQKFRRTYLHLNEIIPHLAKHLKLIKDKELFLTAFSTFFLIEKPLFDYTAHAANSIQTFYANHYLRETLKLNSLPNPESLYNYCKSENFKNDIIEVTKSVSTVKKKGDASNVISEDICKEISQNTLEPSIVLQNIISQFINESLEQPRRYSITDLTYPSEKVFSEIKSSGFYIINDFLNKKSLKQIKEITSIIATSEAKKGTGYFYGETNANQRIYNLIAKHPIFVDLVSHPYMMSLLDRIYKRSTLHEKFGLNSMTGHIVAPGAKAIPMHIDSVVPDPIPNWMIRCIAILALDDFTSNNGATEFVRGSHKFLKRPMPADVKLHKAEIATCKAGSLIIFDGAIWHRSTNNSSKNSRMGLMLSYAASYFMELCGEEEHLTIIPKETLESFSPKMKQMVGYHRAIKKGAMDIDKKIYNKSLY